MFNWRFCLQILLFLLILAWVGLCIKMSCDEWSKPTNEDFPTSTAKSNTGQQLYPYDLVANSQEHDRLFDNGYNSRLLHLIYRTVMRSTNDRRRQAEFERRVAAAHKFVALAAVAGNEQRTAKGVRVNAPQSIDATELVAADEYNMANLTENSS